MAYSPDELYVLGLMAREAAPNSESEYLANEYAVFAAQQMSLENRCEASATPEPEMCQ